MITRWWFQMLFECSPLFGEDSHFDYVSNGLNPPTIYIGDSCWFFPIVGHPHIYVWWPRCRTSESSLYVFFFNEILRSWCLPSFELKTYILDKLTTLILWPQSHEGLVQMIFLSKHVKISGSFRRSFFQCVPWGRSVCIPLGSFQRSKRSFFPPKRDVKG